MTSDETIHKVADVIAGKTTELGSSTMRGLDRATLAARALAEAGLLAPAPNRAPWWRVIGPDGGVWCESSSESEAREKSRPGDTLQQLWETPPVSRWVTVREQEDK